MKQWPSLAEKTIEQHTFRRQWLSSRPFGEREVNDVHGKLQGLFDFLDWYKTTRTYRMRSAQTARRHLPIYFLSRKKVSREIRTSEKTVSLRGTSSSSLKDSPSSGKTLQWVCWGWWLLFFLSLFRLYKYRCDYHRKKKKKKNLFRCHYHSQSLIIHGVTPTTDSRCTQLSLSSQNPTERQSRKCLTDSDLFHHSHRKHSATPPSI